MILHFSQIGFTDGLTFILKSPHRFVVTSLYDIKA